MIGFDKERKLFHLNTDSTSYVMGLTDDRYLGHLYYGPKLENTEGMEHLFRENEFPFTPQVLPRDKVRFTQIYSFEYSFEGTGDFREACISVRNAAGQMGVELHYLNHAVYAGKPKLPGMPCIRGEKDGFETLDITLTDDVLSIDVHLYYTIVKGSDAIVRSVKVVNTGNEELVLTRVMSAMISAEPVDYEVMTLHGTWGRERHIQTVPLKPGSVVAESLRGVSSAEDSPFVGLISPGTNQTQGEVYGMSLIYSGNFLAKVQMDHNGKSRAVMGIHPQNFAWKLSGGESFTTPECVLVYSDEGIGKMTRTFHDLYRNHLIPIRHLTAERPVLVNNWEATKMNFDTDVLLGFAREAKKAGMDMLVMDDGWFGHRDDDCSSLGDWFVDENKLKGGLKYLVDQVNGMGLKFGLWVEPEMICEDSELYRAHPDWMFRLRDRTPGMLRQQYVLDMTRPEVVDGVYSQIKQVLESANIEYVKWDMNRHLADVGNAILPADRQGEIFHRYVLGVYSMQEMLLEDFPHLLLENCSSGGARYDAGMLYYSPQIWTSDDTDAIERLAIQEGTALVFPLSTMGAHVSVSPNEQTGRVTPFGTRAKIAMAGTFGYELDVRHLSEEDKAMMPKQIEQFRRVHPVVREGDYYRIASWRENHSYDAWVVVSKDKKQAFMTFVQVLTEPNRIGRRIRLQGLDPDAMYEVRCDYDGKAAVREGMMTEGSDTTGSVKRFQGRTLMHAGMIVPRVSGDFQAMMYEFTQI